MQRPDYIHWLLSEANYQKSYVIPTNPKQKLADFYVLTHLSTVQDPTAARLGPKITMSSAGDGSRFEKLKYLVDQNLKLLVSHLRAQFLYDLGFSILSEVQSCFRVDAQLRVKYSFEKMARQNFDNEIYKGALMRKSSRFGERTPRFLDGIQDDIEDRKNRGLYVPDQDIVSSKSWLAHLSVNDPTGIARSLEEIKLIFLETEEEEYGGKVWANIADGWYTLYKANNQRQQIVAIDHIIDLQHNNGVAFNKNRSWTIENGDEFGISVDRWLEEFLDQKSILATRKIVRYCSPIVRDLANRMFASDPSNRKPYYRDGSGEEIDDHSERHTVRRYYEKHKSKFPQMNYDDLRRFFMRAAEMGLGKYGIPEDERIRRMLLIAKPSDQSDDEILQKNLDKIM